MKKLGKMQNTAYIKINKHVWGKSQYNLLSEIKIYIVIPI